MATAIRSVLGLIAFGALLFVPAGTLDYWQAWVFLGVFSAMSLLPSVYLNRIDPAAIERRMHAGPKAETRPVQKAVMTGISVSFAGMLVIAGLDHRFGWSKMPTAICVIGDVLMAAGLGVAMLVVYQNRYAAATIRVKDGQPLATAGLYAVVRHPMYSASLVMMVGMALALASYWSLSAAAFGVLLLIARILDEEKLLSQELAGYDAYAQRVRSRLIPRLW